MNHYSTFFKYLNNLIFLINMDIIVAFYLLTFITVILLTTIKEIYDIREQMKKEK